jgi:MscS family membrane protein
MKLPSYQEITSSPLFLEGEWFTCILFATFVGFLTAQVLSHLLKKYNKNPHKSFWILALEASYWPSLGFFTFLILLCFVDICTDCGLTKQQHIQLISILQIALGLSLAWFIVLFKNKAIQVIIEKRIKDEPQIAFALNSLSKIITIIFVIFSIFILHDITGLNLTTLLTFGGIGGLAVAIASQEVIQNFFGGCMLHINRPFFHNDWISLPQNNIEGVVENIGWYHTTVRLFKNVPIYIPNSIFSKSSVINHSRMNGFLLEITFQLSMPTVEGYREFCTSLLEKMRANPVIQKNKRLSVWINEFYGKYAAVNLSAVALPIPLDEFDTLKTAVFIEAQTRAKALGGTLTIPYVRYNQDENSFIQTNSEEKGFQ